jgi:ankyrin repeat protein
MNRVVVLIPVFLCIAVQSWAQGLDADMIQAAKSANAGKIQTLLAKGANVDAQDALGKTALAWASNLGHEEVVSLLLDSGADANLRDRYGSTPLMEAAREGRDNIVVLLVSKREPMRIDYTNLANVLASGSKGRLPPDIRSKVIQLDVRDEKGNTALMMAAAAGRLRAVETLLSKGANPGIRNSGLRAREMAVEKRQGEIVKTLDNWTGNKELTATIFDAIDRNRPERLRELAAQNPEIINIQDRSGTTPLMRAVGNDNAEIAVALIGLGALIDQRDRDGNSALMRAISSNRKGMVSLLLNRGADPDMKNNQGKSSADLAGAAKNPEIVNRIRSHGENNRKLIEAVKSGALDQTGKMLGEGAYVESMDGHGDNALILASALGSGEIVKLLVDHGANPQAQNKEHETALVAAARECRSQIVKYLIQAGAKIKDDENNEHPAIQFAIQSAQENRGDECVEVRDFFKTKFPDQFSAAAAELGNTDLLKEMLAMNLSPEAKNTALIGAVRFGQTDAVKMLLEAAADTPAAIVEAATEGDIDLAKLLVGKGIRPSIEALFAAAGNDHAETVLYLLENGLSPNGANSEGRTPLMEAAVQGSTDAVGALLENGADASLKDKQGHTALDLAKTNGHEEAAALLTLGPAKIKRK